MDNSILDATGSSLVRVDSPEGSTVMAKMELKNPDGSVKDHPVLVMAEAVEGTGDISPGDRLVEPMSGNAGIGLAVVAAAKGYDLTAAMPDSTLSERRETMRAYGATIELVDGGTSAVKDRADDLKAEGTHQLRQLENPANPEAHYRATVEEALEQVGDRRTDALVAGIGTGGMISDTDNRLVEEFPLMRVVGVGPVESAVFSGREAGNNDFQGMGPGLVSPNLDTDFLDDVKIVELTDAETECRRLAREKGAPVGQSSGASLLAARRVAERLAVPDADEEGQPLMVTVSWDSDECYISTGMLDAEE